MLQKLSIKNFAIIDQLEIDFYAGFNIITGETGAGKSIILGALGLLLGQRADTKSLKKSDKKCIIEGQFNIQAYQLQDFFKQNDIDYEELSILRREISSDGKSRAFINDTPVNLQLLRAMGSSLVDIHSQHETLEIHAQSYQLALIDSVADHKDLLIEYKNIYNSYQKNQTELRILEEQHQKLQNELEYIKFQFNELSELNLKPEEQETLEAEQNILSNAEEIQTKLSALSVLFSEDPYSILNQVKHGIQLFQGLEKINPSLNELSNRLKSALIELKDIHAEVENAQQEVNLNPARLEEVNARLDVIYRIEQKHRVKSIAELLEILKTFDDKIQSSVLDTERIEKIKIELEHQKSTLLKIAKQISTNRVNQFENVRTYLIECLKSLGIPNAQFEISHRTLTDGIGKNGIDELNFLFSANKGQSVEDLSRVASGGELSRLMLCIKSLLAEKEKLPTIIFDEIDTGVSGEVAIKMGQIMRQLSSKIQVISITHLPQIAGLGNHHYYVYKDHQQSETITMMKKLNNDERIVEIAKMLSGDKPSAGALENAKELLNNN
jgi:DNA repair protein RecN (Recombination protein N)